MLVKSSSEGSWTAGGALLSESVIAEGQTREQSVRTVVEGAVSVYDGREADDTLNDVLTPDHGGMNPQHATARLGLSRQSTGHGGERSASRERPAAGQRLWVIVNLPLLLY